MPIVPPGGPRSSGNRSSTTNTSSVTIQNLTVVTQATDAPGTAKDIGEHLKRVARVMPANYGLA